MSEYTEEEIQEIVAKIMREAAREKLDEKKIREDYAVINKELIDNDEVHPVFGRCIASFSLEEYAHINQTYGHEFFADDESIRFHQRVRGQEFLRKR